ncbi:uncharacterized protein LOC116145515 [Pistacia vera]|uniref:uncharacterized protein LOC116145515 n=1 Tax=Pistacia vera TaxID=55513 RepID=UPI001263C478|nr:uncharacterized protein LOC116145515 [Pistacia vera]
MPTPSPILARHSHVPPSHPPLLFMQWPANWKEQLPNKPPAEAMGIEQADCWMTPVVRYLENDELPTDKNEVRRLKARAARFTIHESQLFRKSFSGPYLKCVSPKEAQSVLAELHEGEYGNHARGRSLAHRVITAGYYWPNICTDSTAYVKTAVRGLPMSHTSHQSDYTSSSHLGHS